MRLRDSGSDEDEAPLPALAGSRGSTVSHGIVGHRGMRGGALQLLVDETPAPDVLELQDGKAGCADRRTAGLLPSACNEQKRGRKCVEGGEVKNTDN